MRPPIAPHDGRVATASERVTLRFGAATVKEPVPEMLALRFRAATVREPVPEILALRSGAATVREPVPEILASKQLPATLNRRRIGFRSWRGSARLIETDEEPAKLGDLASERFGEFASLAKHGNGECALRPFRSRW
jgi:hypothetical protein